MNEPTDEIERLDLAGFRTAAIAEKEWTPDSVHQHAMSAHDTIQRQTQRILALIDRIESLEARLARATDDTMAERIKEAIHAAYVTSPGSGNVPWLDQRQAEANVLAAIRAAAADEQEADSGPA